MKIAIGCSGPSLSETVHQARFWADRAFAINDAINFPMPWDWMVLGDTQTFSRIDNHPHLGYCCPEVIRPHGPRGERYVYWEELKGLMSDPVECNFSLTAALALAGYFKATHIRLYGCDWGGKADWTGSEEFGYGRSDGRWEKEKSEIVQIVRFVKSRGVLSVIRVLPDNKEIYL